MSDSYCEACDITCSPVCEAECKATANSRVISEIDENGNLCGCGSSCNSICGTECEGTVKSIVITVESRVDVLDVTKVKYGDSDILDKAKISH